MCKMILPGMENRFSSRVYMVRWSKPRFYKRKTCNRWSSFHRGKGLILNMSSGIASIPFPMYTLYGASKVQTCTPGLSLFICVLTGIFHPCRFLWSDFLKAFKLNTKTKGSLFRYLLRLRHPLNHCRPLWSPPWVSGGGSVRGLHSNGGVSADQHGDSVSRRLCPAFPVVPQSRRQNVRQCQSHHHGERKSHIHEQCSERLMRACDLCVHRVGYCSISL